MSRVFTYFTVHDTVLAQFPAVARVMERSCKFKRGLDELVPQCREVLKDFHKKSRERKITDLILPIAAISFVVNPDL